MIEFRLIRGNEYAFVSYPEIIAKDELRNISMLKLTPYSITINNTTYQLPMHDSNFPTSSQLFDNGTLEIVHNREIVYKGRIASFSSQVISSFNFVINLVLEEVEEQ